MRKSIGCFGAAGLLLGLASTAQAQQVEDILPLSGASTQEIAPEVAEALASGAMGDVNSDGKVNIVDALMIAQYYVGMQLTGFAIEYADVNWDAKVNIVDALIVAQWYVGMDPCDGVDNNNNGVTDENCPDPCDGKDNNGDGQTDEGCPEYSFFVFADVQTNGTDAASLDRAVQRMQEIDSAAARENPADKAVAAFSVGDLTATGSATQWQLHNEKLGTLFDLQATGFGSSTPAYLAALGNHDGPDIKYSGPTWASKWNGTAFNDEWHLGFPGEPEDLANGVYYSMRYRNALFAVMDSENVTGYGESVSDEENIYAHQTGMLEEALEQANTPFTFLFFHKPVYACWDEQVGEMGPGMRWLQMVEDRNAVVFNGHTHVYTRSRARRDGQVSADGTGVVQVELGTLSNTSPGPQWVSTDDNLEVTGTLWDGTDRTDYYDCKVDGGDLEKVQFESADRSHPPDHHFCRVHVDSCVATLHCYSVETGAEIDTWEINHCPE